MEQIYAAVKKLRDNLMFEETAVGATQIQGVVKERNEYRQLLDECLYAFNVLPNQRITGNNMTTYMMASKIDAVFKKFHDR